MKLYPRDGVPTKTTAFSLLYTYTNALSYVAASPRVSQSVHLCKNIILYAARCNRFSTGTKYRVDTMNLRLCRSDTDKGANQYANCFRTIFFENYLFLSISFPFTSSIDVTHSDSMNAINMTGRVVTLIVRKGQLQLFAFSISNF